MGNIERYRRAIRYNAKSRITEFISAVCERSYFIFTKLYECFWSVLLIVKAAGMCEAHTWTVTTISLVSGLRVISLSIPAFRLVVKSLFDIRLLKYKVNRFSLEKYLPILKTIAQSCTYSGFLLNLHNRQRKTESECV